MTAVRNRPGSVAAAFAAVALASAAVNANGGECPGDMDADGEVSVDDLVAVIVEWGCTAPGPCAADVNADTRVTVEDLIMVLVSWGPCPGGATRAADAGLLFAAQTLAREAARFVITKGEVDASYARDIWLGTYDPADGDVAILPAQAYDGDRTVDSLVRALLDAHSHTRTPVPLPRPSDAALPEIDRNGTLRVRPIPLDPDARNGPYFRLEYELLDQGPCVRVTSQGVDGDIARTVRADFRIDKRIEFAVISPSRIMIGKNVLVEGALGTRYGIVPGELDGADADPLMMRGDFYHLDQSLDSRLDVLYRQIVLYDVDGDNRLRPDHPVESQGLIGRPALVDYDGDKHVDDFDLFLAHYDRNGDARVVYDSEPTGGMTEEFRGIDDQLAHLIDEARPDRDGDGRITAADTALGYRDGVLDVLDSYAKVRGRLAFAVARDAWDDASDASYQTQVQGPVRPEHPHKAPVSFEVSTDELPEITTAMVDSSSTWFHKEAQTGVPFGTYDARSDTWSDQVAFQISVGGTYEPPGPTTWEPIPYGSPGAYDYYQRQIFRNMTFENVRVPTGTNALFENCTFVGVAFIETEADCDHVNWNYAGALEPVIDPVTGLVTYEPRFPGLEAELGGVPVPDTKLLSNNIRFHNCTFLGSVSGDRPNEYTHWRNRVNFTGATRFYLDPDDPDLREQADARDLLVFLNGMDPADRKQLVRSSIFLPGWSVGLTNQHAVDPEDTPKAKLSGAIVAGIFEARGTLEISGTLLVTFRPVAEAGPLFYGGRTADFKTAIGYFEPVQGDSGQGPGHHDFPGFGEIVLRHDPDASLPDGIPWRLCVQPVR